MRADDLSPIIIAPDLTEGAPGFLFELLPQFDSPADQRTEPGVRFDRTQ